MLEDLLEIGLGAQVERADFISNTLEVEHPPGGILDR